MMRIEQDIMLFLGLNDRLIDWRRSCQNINYSHPHNNNNNEEELENNQQNKFKKLIIKETNKKTI